MRATLRTPRAVPYLEMAAFVGTLAMFGMTWYSFASAPAGGTLLPSSQVAILLIATLIPSLGLVVLAGRRMALKRAAGGTARLHVRLVFFFSIIAAVPTLLVAGFAAFLFQSGVDFWFSDNSRGLMRNASELAREYQEQNQIQLAGESSAMAGDLRYYFENGGNLAITNADIVYFVSYQMSSRQIHEAAILRRVSDGSMRTAAIYNLTKASDPGLYGNRVVGRLLAGESVVVEANDARIEALSPISKGVDANGEGLYLYTVRDLEQKGFQSWERAKAITAAYSSYTNKARALQLRFNLALYFVSIALVGLAVWFALRFADYQVKPLNELVVAAGRVGSGNYALRVEGRTGADEIGLLNRAFNRMTAQIEQQTDTLMKVNGQLSERRAFMEALLESITAGIVSLDHEGNIRLMNASAQELLGTEKLANYLGAPLADIAPQIAGLVEAGVSGGVVSHAKGGELLTLAVKIASTSANSQANSQEGHVVTFEDITRQLLDQRQAAWSDVARRIAHEIKNPLTPIQLAAERLKRRYRKTIEQDGELFDDLTETIVRQVGSLRAMVDEFSSFARLPKPVFRQEDISDLAKQALFLQEVAHPEINFNFRLVGGRAINSACDRHQIGQALTNVLKNAVEAVEAKAVAEEPDYRGDIRVEISSDDQFVSIEVADNGVGLPQDRERIAEPYVTTREGGTGLGLAIVKKIVEEHGGEMIFANRESGGSMVTLKIGVDPAATREVAI